MHRSHAPGFPTGISDLTIKRATNYLAKIEYAGPVSISCDDTQLLSKMAPYFDGQKNKWLLLGGIGEGIAIDGDAKDIELLIGNAVKGTEKATKVTHILTITSNKLLTNLYFSVVCGVFKCQLRESQFSFWQQWQ
jgi:hypothetical protein